MMMAADPRARSAWLAALAGVPAAGVAVAIGVVVAIGMVVALGVVAPSGAAVAQDTARNAEVDAIFATWDSPASPGCALGVVEAGELVYERGYGAANLDWGIPVSTDTVFYVGSLSKQFTAAAVALMALEGEISLDDDVRQYFPELPVFERPITVRQLVHHTSGIRDIYTLMALAGIRLEDVFSDEDAIGLIAAQKATNFPPGEEHLYSNSGYFLLAQLVERVTGKTLREYAGERIFAPLGMRDTHFHDRPGHIVERRATSYQREGDGGFRVSYLGNFDKVGAGGLYTTIGDLLLWDRNFYTGDLGGDAFLGLIHTTGVLAGGDNLVYAFGLNVDDYRGLATVSHGGSMMGFKAAFLQFPGERFSVFVACNLGDIEPMELAQKVADIYLQDHFEEPADGASATAVRDPETWAPLSAEERARFAGVYHSDELDVSYELTDDDGTLWLRLRNTPPRRVEKRMPPGEGIWVGRGQWRLEFESGADGLIEGFTINAGRVTDIRFSRR